MLEDAPSAALNLYLDDCQAIQDSEHASLWVFDPMEGTINAGAPGSVLYFLTETRVETPASGW